jgi:hypothetical protein
MNRRKIVTAVLLAFVAVSAGYLVVTVTQTAEDATETAQGAPAPCTSHHTSNTPAHRVIVYYFHNTQRCPTCLKIERLAHNALKAEFADALKRGVIEWLVLNMEETANEHFVVDYALVTSSLVIVDLHEGVQRAWTNMGRVWELVHDDETAFTAYVAKQVRTYLEPSL